MDYMGESMKTAMAFLIMILLFICPYISLADDDYPLVGDPLGEPVILAGLYIGSNIWGQGEGGGISNGILLETGSYFLLETGDKLLKE